MCDIEVTISMKTIMTWSPTFLYRSYLPLNLVESSAPAGLRHRQMDRTVLAPSTTPEADVTAMRASSTSSDGTTSSGHHSPQQLASQPVDQSTEAASAVNGPDMASESTQEEKRVDMSKVYAPADPNNPNHTREHLPSVLTNAAHFSTRAVSSPAISRASIKTPWLRCRFGVDSNAW